MIALLRKDRPWMRSCIIGGVAVMTVALMRDATRDSWILPPRAMPNLHVVGWIWGLLLGIIASTFDERHGTRDLLEHRPVSRHGLHAARVLACAAVLATWSVLPPFLSAGIAEILDPMGRSFWLENITYYWLGALPCVSACAIGLFVGALPFRHFGRIACALPLLHLSFTLISACAEPGSENEQAAIESSLWIFAGLHVLAAIAFVVASFALCGSRADADRPRSSTMLFLGIGSTVLTATMALSFVAYAWEGRQSAELLRQYPEVVRRSSGDLALLRCQYPHRDGNRPPMVIADFVDAQHESLELPGQLIRERVAQPGPYRFSIPFFAPPRLHWRTSGTFFEDGKYCELQRHERDGTFVNFVLRRFGKGSEQAPFAADAKRVGPSYPISGPLHLVFEPSSRQLWKLDWDLEAFVPLALPDAEPLLDVVWRSGEAEFLGAQQVYVFDTDHFKRMRANIEREELPQESFARSHRPEYEADLLTPIVRVFDAQGAQIFEHRYAPRTPGERWSASLLLAASFARPPLLSAISHLWAAPMETQNALVEPLVAGGRRGWLVALHLLCGALCATLALWRLRRIGADRRAQWFWGVLALLLGIAPLLASFLLERRRAWSRGPALEPVPPPRIVSASQVAPLPA